MKKNVFYLLALICSVSLFTACSDDDNNGGDTPPVSGSIAGNYVLNAYTAGKYVVEGTGKELANYPLSSPLYVDYKVSDQSEADGVAAVAGILRMMGGAMLPQVLAAVELKADGNILAGYVKNPVLKGTDKLMTWGWGAMGGTYPEADEITSLAATSGFVPSPSGLATWTEENGNVLVKLNIVNILAAAMGGESAPELEELLNTVLTMEPAEFKELLKALNIDFTKVSDETIRAVQHWALHGMPMHKTVAGGHTYLYLAKSDWDTFFKPRDADGQECDFLYIYMALSQAGIIPQDAAAAVFMFAGITANWNTTTTFNIGLDLVKVMAE